jgi:hypothetical protein
VWKSHTENRHASGVYFQLKSDVLFVRAASACILGVRLFPLDTLMQGRGFCHSLPVTEVNLVLSWMLPVQHSLFGADARDSSKVQFSQASHWVAFCFMGTTQCRCNAALACHSATTYLDSI